MSPDPNYSNYSDLSNIIRRAREGPDSYSTGMSGPMGSSYGALVIYANLAIGTTATVYALDEKGGKAQPYYSSLEQYTNADGKSVRAAVFPTLPPGNYVVNRPGWTTSTYEKKMTVFPGHVVETTYN